jgi:protein TonB
MIVLFSYSQPDVREPEDPELGEIVDVPVIEITRPEPPKVPQNAAPRLQLTADILQVVKDDKKIETELTFADPDEDIDFTTDFSKGGGTYEGELEPEPEWFAEEMPSFPLGNFSTWISKQVGGDNYPVAAAANGLEGVVNVHFTVEKDGSVTNVVVNNPDPTIRILNDAAVAAISKSPKWNPAKNRGVPVRLRVSVPVNFQLR